MKLIRRLTRSAMAAASCSLFVAQAVAEETSSKQPNIVVILADDMGYGDPACYNPQSKIPTPNIDKLAEQGMRFTDAHTPSSLCTPTRYGLLTGRYAWRTYMKNGVLGPYCLPLIDNKRPTLASILQKRGYSTAIVGKWHLGMRWSTKDPKVKQPKLWKYSRTIPPYIDLSKPIQEGPLSVGFQSYFGVDVPNFPPYCFLENDRIVGEVPTKPKPNNMYGDAGRMQEGWDLHKILPTLRDRAVSYIEKSAKAADKPFFLYMPLTSPHRPIVPNKEWKGKSKAGDYGDFIAETDGVVGDVMQALERAGVADNTLVIFTSDNGSCGPAGDPHIRGPKWHVHMSVSTMFKHHPNAPWRGMKADAFEGGHRVPFVVRWPGRVAAASTNAQTICLTDLMRTLAGLVGEPLTADAAEDSVDLMPSLKDPKTKVREDVVHHSGNGMFAIRKGDWKLIFGKGSGGWSKVRVNKQAPQGQLYNLAKDPKEQNNLYLEHPELVKELSAQLQQYKKSGRSVPHR